MYKTLVADRHTGHLDFRRSYAALRSSTSVLLPYSPTTVVLARYDELKSIT